MVDSTSYDVLFHLFSPHHNSLRNTRIMQHALLEYNIIIVSSASKFPNEKLIEGCSRVENYAGQRGEHHALPPFFLGTERLSRPRASITERDVPS